MSWIRITHADNIPLREGRAVQLAGEEVAIFNLGEKFLAVANRCPHRGGPLADGMLSGDSVVCPLHAWKVCLLNTPTELIAEVVRAGRRKANLGIGDMLLRGALAGVFLGFATSLVFIVQTQGVPAMVEAILFPVGFVMLVLLGLELVTGHFAVLPPAMAAGEISLGRLLRAWFRIYLGNLAGSVGYALLFYLAITNCGMTNGGPPGDLLRAFFAQGFEHSVVNMFVIPAGMLLHAPVSPAAWWLWNQIPVTLGNILSGSLFTGLASTPPSAPGPHPNLYPACPNPSP
jgi:formate transporter